MTSQSFHTLCAKEVPDPKTTRPHILPLYLTSSFDFDTVEQGINIFEKKEKGHVYGRYANPTVEAVENKLAAMEAFGIDVEPGCQLFSSGLAAIYTLLISLLDPGDTILTAADLYGGTTELFQKVISKSGVKLEFTDFSNPDQVQSQISAISGKGIVFCETPSNPTHACTDLEILMQLAGSRSFPVVIDNTFATPYLQQPFKFGADFIVHSTTKYLNGHGNGIGGAVVGRDREFVHGRLWEFRKLIGTTLSPFEAWLVNQGLKTLPMRMDRHSTNALAIAQFLEGSGQVSRVNYCGLPSHASHEIASRQMSAFGGILSFELKGGLEAGIRFMQKTRQCALAPTLGDVDTLVLHPASMSHINVDRSLREKYGITDGLVRLSVGIEDPADLIDDIAQAIS